jgi:pimeloyl-ACP methyl ester carboxylesterase
MRFSRRGLLQAAAAAPLLATQFPRLAQAQGTAAPAAGGSDLPPILFLHGNGDHAALWLTTLWRFESNGVSRDRLIALNFTDPQARNSDAEPQAGRSSTEDQMKELAAAVDAAKGRTGAAKVALVANSRGGYPIRNYVVLNNGSPNVSHAVLCGVPNRGVFAWEQSPGSEFNGRGPFPHPPQWRRHRRGARHRLHDDQEREQRQVRAAGWAPPRAAGRADRRVL